MIFFSGTGWIIGGGAGVAVAVCADSLAIKLAR
jgi:hypothetical protein